MTLLGDNLKRYRGRRTFTEMAQESGVHTSTLSRVEHQPRGYSPSIRTIVAVARAYELSPGLVAWWAIQDEERE